jgi:hypothetical protein
MQSEYKEFYESLLYMIHIMQDINILSQKKAHKVFFNCISVGYIITWTDICIKIIYHIFFN